MGKIAVIIHRAVNGQVVRAAKVIIVHTVTGGNVHESRARAVFHKRVAGVELSGFVDERMTIFQGAHGITGERFNLLYIFPAASLGHLGQQRAFNNVRLTIDAHFFVREPRVVGHREVGRQRPRGGGPNNKVRVVLVRHRKFHKHTLADMVGIFHLRLGQRGAAGDAPVHGLFAAVHEAFLDDVRKQPQLIGLVFFIESQVRIVPITKHAEALELRALMVNELACVGITFAADLRRGGILAACLAKLLHHLEFNRQPVTIPARHIRHIFAPHGLKLEDDILERFIECRANVHIAIGEGRAVMQYEGLFGLYVAVSNAGVQILRIPLLEPLRLTLHQTGFHGETSLRQV